MLSVYSPLQHEPTSSFPFYPEMRSSLSSQPSSSFQYSSSQDTQPISSSSSRLSSSPVTAPSSTNQSRGGAENSSIKTETMMPSQPSVGAQPQTFASPFYSSAELSSSTKSAQYVSPPYTTNNRLTIHDRRQSMMAGRSKVQMHTPPNSNPRPSLDYSAQNTTSSLTEELQNQPEQPAGSWDQSQTAYTPAQPNLPSLAEAIQGVAPEAPQPAALSPPTQQTATLAMDAVVASPPNFYGSTSYLDMQAPASVYPTQEQYDNDAARMQDHNQNPVQTMMTQESSGYDRRVSYPFANSLQTAPELMAASVIPEPSNSGSLHSSSAFAHGGLVGTAVHDMAHTQPSIAQAYMDSMTLQSHAQQPSSMGHSQPSTWSQDGEMASTDGSVNGSKVYSFVPLSGVNSKKRPRRRFDEIERLYVCNWGDCEKSYGTLNHLNAHVNMQKHGPKRLPAEFKELRKAWRRHKRAEEEAAKQAAAFHHQQQGQNQGHGHSHGHGHGPTPAQTQAQLQMCGPVLTQVHAQHPTLPMHSIGHHQPPQLPHPHAHPNQHPHHAQRAHTQHGHHQGGQHHPHHSHHAYHHQHPIGF
ncbi:transcription factor CON7 [Entomortierella parvispora]|uniref:Transcription factor CON7 n=1 Tax=Entomortierella parvispora TaxID=205924 RepID=A0A9P3HAK9_9FUNG|nr:transcription factor CON7 [Entomortierella parvispora]